MPLLIVDSDLCSRCGICAAVCPIKIISPPDAETPPAVPEEMIGGCLECGHCETCCPTEALLLNLRPEHKIDRPTQVEVMRPDALGAYLRRRRSIRHFKAEPVSDETISQILDIARYAPSSGNSQPVRWLVFRDHEVIRHIAGLTIDWLRSLIGTDNALAPYVHGVIGAWDAGMDLVCYDAPCVIVAHVPTDDEPISIDAVIGLTHVDVLAPSFGLGTCWAGFLSMAAAAWQPLRQAMALPEGRKFAYAMLCGRPRYVSTGVPRREPLDVVFR